MKERGRKEIAGDACEGVLTCERIVHPQTEWHSRLMPNGMFVEWTDDGKVRVTEDEEE